MTEDKQTGRLAPSNSTVGSAVGGMFATLLILALTQWGFKIDAIAAVSIGGGMSALAGWFFKGGKASDT